MREKALAAQEDYTPGTSNNKSSGASANYKVVLSNSFSGVVSYFQCTVEMFFIRLDAL